MELIMEDLPKCIKSSSFSPKAIFSDMDSINFILETKEYLFGLRCLEAAEKLGIDLFDLVFVNEMPFCDRFDKILKKQDYKEIDILKTAYLLKCIYCGDYVRIARVRIKGDIAYIKPPEYCFFRFVGVPNRKNKYEKLPEKNTELNKKSSVILESLRLRALGYSMSKCMEYKEMIDKSNYYRFSTHLRLNTRPAGIGDINAAMSLRKDRLFADFSKDKTRINFSVLYAIAYGNYTMEELFSLNKLNDRENKKSLADLSSDLLTIIYNGNGIEISSMMINMIVSFSQIKLPPVSLDRLDIIIDNYSIYYAIANLAAICENMFRFDSGRQNEMREYMNRHAFFNYWTVMDRLSLMKQYSTIVSFCYKLSMFDAELYRDDPEYQGSVQYSYDCAVRFAEELKAYE